MTTVSPVPHAAPPDADADGGRWELLRALGALTLATPPTSDRLSASLGLPTWSRADHTRTFVLGLPPYASIHLGAEGKLGGEAADRVAGVWRVLGLTPPADADHLGVILGLYCELGEASRSAATPATRTRLDRTRATVLWEHLWTWVPAYTSAVGDGDDAAEPWARLLRRAMAREALRTQGAPQLPLALRVAPATIDAAMAYPELLDALVATVRVGFVLTHTDLIDLTEHLGVGLRRGERRFVLDAVLRQDAGGGLAWLAGHARRWALRHTDRPAVTADPGPWWAARAATSADVLEQLAAKAIS